MPGSSGTLAADFSRALFGARTRLVELLVPVTVNATLLIQNNPDRYAWTISNNGNQYVYLSQDARLTAATGLPIPPGGTATMTIHEDGEAVTYQWYAISSSGTQNVYYLEEEGA